MTEVTQVYDELFWAREALTNIYEQIELDRVITMLFEIDPKSVDQCYCIVMCELEKIQDLFYDYSCRPGYSDEDIPPHLDRAIGILRDILLIIEDVGLENEWEAKHGCY